MFDSVCIRDQSAGKPNEPLDLGFLAECLLFYREVRVVGHVAILRQLVPACGPDVLLELLQGGWLKIGYLETSGGIYTQNSGSPVELHSPIAFTSPTYELQDAAPKIFTEATGRQGRGRRLAQRFTSLVDLIPYEERILEATRAEIVSADLGLCFQEVLSVLAPEYQPSTKPIVHVTEQEGQFSVKTNIDFDKANASYHKRVSPKDSSLTVAYLLSLILNTRENLQFASTFSSELATNPALSSLLRLRVESLVNVHLGSVARFQDFILNDGRAIREAINSGQRTFADLLKLLERADKFKKWLEDQPPDADLCKAYHQAVTKETWIDSLPTKTLRWVMFTGAGIGVDVLGGGGIGTAVGVGLSAADAFLLDRLISGWKPNQFIEGELRRFAKKASPE